MKMGWKYGSRQTSSLNPISMHFLCRAFTTVSAAPAVPTAKIPEFYFPPSAKQSFINFVEPFFAQGISPYHDFESMRFPIAQQFLKSLEDANRYSDQNYEAERIIEAIKLTRACCESPAFVIHGFPVDPKSALLTTPSDPKKFDPDVPANIGKVGHITEWAMLAFNTVSGKIPYINPMIQGGFPFTHVCPRIGLEENASNAGTGFFPVHTDAQYAPIPPDGLTLAALKNIRTQTVIIDGVDIDKALHKVLTPKEFKLLSKPIFKFVPGVAYTEDSDEFIIAPMITRDTNGKIERLRLNANNKEKVFPAKEGDKVAQHIIDTVSEVLESLKEGYVLKPGDLLRVNNARAAHSRTSIHPDDLERPNTRHLVRQTTISSDKLREDFEKYQRSR